jgi:hypothetical protein
MSRSLTTREAARYLTERGVRRSKSKLEKDRTRGKDDPRDPGPAFYRDRRTGVCWYDTPDLDRYIAQEIAGREFRAPAPQPENFRKAG